MDMFDAFSVDIQTTPRLVAGGIIHNRTRIPQARDLAFPTDRWREFVVPIEYGVPIPDLPHTFVELGFTGGIQDYGGRWNYTFQFRVEDGITRPNEFPNAGAVFIMDRTAPAGTVSFDWLIQGNVHHQPAAQWHITKFMRLAVVCPNNRHVYKHEHFTTEAQFQSVPTEWSPEVQGIRFPIQPGHTARFVFEMRHFGDTATRQLRRAIALVGGSATFYGQNDRHLEVTNQEILQMVHHDDSSQ